MIGYRLYDVDGVYMRLSSRQAEALGASEVAEPDDARPARNASKAEWVAYATAQGMDADAADAQTRKQLIEQYG